MGVSYRWRELFIGEYHIDEGNVRRDEGSMRYMEETFWGVSDRKRNLNFGFHIYGVSFIWEYQTYRESFIIEYQMKGTALGNVR